MQLQSYVVRHLLLVLLASCAASQGLKTEADQVDQAVEKIIATARKLLRNGRDLEAHRVVNEAIRAEVKAPILWKKRGQIYLLLDAFEPASQDLTDFLTLNPSDGESWFLLGHAYQRLHRFGKALECLSRASKLGYLSPDLNVLLKSVSEFVAKQSDLLEEMETVPEHRQTHDYWWAKTRMNIELDRSERAQDAVDKWKVALPQDRASSWGLAYVLMESADWVKAEELLIAYGKLEPGTSGDRLLAELFAKQGEWDKVLERTKLVLDREPADEQALRLRAIAFLVEGRYEAYRQCAAAAAEAARIKK